jgi:hypothetical protein
MKQGFNDKATRRNSDTAEQRQKVYFHPHLLTINFPYPTIGFSIFTNLFS